MRRLSVLLIVGALTAAWLTQPRPADAGEVSISLGIGFAVGGATFHVVHGPGRHVPYYYRLETPLYGPGYDCTTYCYASAGHHYHAPFCPLVRYHFEVHRYEGYWRHAYRYGPAYLEHRHHRGHWRPRRYDHGRHSRHYRGYERPRHRHPHKYYRDSGRHRDRRYQERYAPHADSRARSFDRSRAGHGKGLRYDRDERHRKRVSRGNGSAHRTRPRP